MRSDRTEVAKDRSIIVAGAKGTARWDEIDPSVARASRVYDYLLGGSVHFAADRDAAEHAWAADPGGLDVARSDLRANRAFLVQAVRYLATDVGIRQFLDIGTGVPTAENVHQVAQQAAPSARVVSVGYDPIVLAHAHQLRAATPQGAADYVHGDLRSPAHILQQAAATLDLSARPVALVLVGILCLLSDEDDPHGVVAELLNAVPAGSYLVVSHLASDIEANEVAEMARRLSESMREPLVPRTHAQVCRFFDGMDVVEPGVVPLDHWQLPETEPSRADGRAIHYYGGIGRKTANLSRSVIAPTSPTR